MFNRQPPAAAFAGQSVGFTLAEQIFVGRGELAAVAGEPRPQVTTRLKASVFWLGRQPLRQGRDYFLKLGTTRVPMRVEDVHRVMDAATLASVDTKSQVDRHEVAECTLKLARATAFDRAEEIAGTSRFVIVDDYEIRGGGIVREALPDMQSQVRDQVLLRNLKWELSNIGTEQRAERYRQRATLLLITSESASSRKALAKAVEQRLFDLGNIVYFVGMGNVLYGVDADLERGRAQRHEHLRRLAEVANLMLDAGVILVASAADLTQEDVELIKTTVDPDRIQTIWAGETTTTDLNPDLVVSVPESPDAAELVKQLLQDRGIIYRPW
jgi:bifunctional enzyme CysN/CysC